MVACSPALSLWEEEKKKDQILSVLDTVTNRKLDELIAPQTSAHFPSSTPISISSLLENSGNQRTRKSYFALVPGQYQQGGSFPFQNPYEKRKGRWIQWLARRGKTSWQWAADPASLIGPYHSSCAVVFEQVYYKAFHRLNWSGGDNNWYDVLWCQTIHTGLSKVWTKFLPRSWCAVPIYIRIKKLWWWYFSESS